MDETLVKSDDEDNEVKIIKHKILHLIIRITQIALVFLTLVCVILVVWKFWRLLGIIKRTEEENSDILDKVSAIQHESTELNIVLRKELDVQNKLIEKITILNKLYNEKINKKTSPMNNTH